jgi:hypothetical protein
VSGGIEIGSWAGADQFDPRSILDLARGSFDGGTLGPLLQDIFLNEGADFEYVGEERTDASTLLEYRFQIPGSTSHYFIRTGGDRSGGLAYQGSIWIDADSFDLRRLQVRVDGLPPEAHTCLVTTTADYQRTRIGNGDFLVPRESVLRMLMTDSSVTDTTLAYSACREYQSESTINFGAEATPGVTESKASSGATAPLPAGLAFSIVLSNPIDTGSAAAGDVVVATIRKTVVNRASKAVLIPAGATVRGRIVRMEDVPGSHFLIAIQLVTLESGGVQAPLYSRPDERPASLSDTEQTDLRRPGVHILLPPIGESRGMASFVFRTGRARYVVPAHALIRVCLILGPARGCATSATAARTYAHAVANLMPRTYRNLRDNGRVTTECLTRNSTNRAWR